MKMKNAVIITVVAGIFAVAGGYFSLKHSELQAAQDSAVSDLFAASIPDSTGKVHPLSVLKGKTLLVNFWATWCAPCVQEMPELSALQLDANAKNIQIIGIGIDSASNISDFSSRYKINYPLYVADNNSIELARKFGNQSGGLPFTVLIDPDGHIKKSYLGRLKMPELKHDLNLN
jgi:thiol-disulfide isomerase/thioredoxin